MMCTCIMPVITASGNFKLKVTQLITFSTSSSTLIMMIALRLHSLAVTILVIVTVA